MSAAAEQDAAGAAGKPATAGCTACNTRKKVAHALNCPRRRRSTVGGPKTLRANDLAFSEPGPAWSRTDTKALQKQLRVAREENAEVRLLCPTRCPPLAR